MQESKYEQALRIISNYEKPILTERLVGIRYWIHSEDSLSNIEKKELLKALDDKFNELRDKPGGHYGC